MSNHETTGADGPDYHDELAGAEAGAPREGAEPADGPATTPADAAGATDEGPRILRARARTVAAGSMPDREDADASEEAVAANARAGDGRSTVGADRVEITRGGAIDVEAGTVHVDRGGIGAARADTVDVRRGGIGRLVATSVGVTQGGIGAARAERISVDMGAVGAAMVGRLDLSRGFARSILAREAHLEQAGAQTVVANHVTMGRGSGALVVVARRVEGDVRTLLDWRGALALGAALGLIVGLIRTGSRAAR
jgi:hypothetical protein